MKPPLTATRQGKTHRLELTFSHQFTSVRLVGDIDLLAAHDVARLLESLDPLTVPIHVDLESVTFIDSSGLQPLIDATRRRRDQEMPPLLIGTCSRPARRLLNCTNLHGDPLLDVAAWDRLWRNHQGLDVAAWRTATPTAPDPVQRCTGSGANKPAPLADGRPGRPHGNSYEHAQVWPGHAANQVIWTSDG